MQQTLFSKKREGEKVLEGKKLGNNFRETDRGHNL